MWFAISSIATLATAVAVAQPAADRPSINPPAGVVHAKHRSEGAVPAGPLTNAERFAAGLPPLPPKPRHHGRRSKVDSARRAVASPSLPITATCLLEVTDKSSGSVHGYVSNGYYMGYAVVDPVENLRKISLTYTPTEPTSLSDINVRSGTDDHPFFGLTMSYYSSDNNLSTANDNYAWFSTTDQTGKAPTTTGNSPQDGQGSEQPSESPIWKYNPATGVLVPTWYNTDGSPATTIPVIVDTILYATGNVDKLKGRLNRPEVDPITFRAVQCTYT